MKSKIIFLVKILLCSFCLVSVSFYFLEHGKNPAVNSFWDVIWWWITTSSTVGYGDIVPVTAGGKAAATIAIVTGIYLYTNFITLTADSMHNMLDRHKLGLVKVNCRDHIVICEYTAFADELIQEMNNYEDFKGREVVIVSDLVNMNPYPQHRFIRGVPINPEYLKMAGIQDASHIFVFANARFQEPDIKTLHLTARIRQLNSRAKLYVELKDPDPEFTRHIKGQAVIMESRCLMKSLLSQNSLNLQQFTVAG